MNINDLKWRAIQAAEDFVIWIVWMLPRQVIYWAAIRLIAHATQGPHSDQPVDQLTAMVALDRWYDRREKQS